tara:strand:+ start:69 stop:794 length:726 start_codon:yes stop_codon:yes gene_type:complete
MSENRQFISQATLHRLLKDVKEIIKNPLESEGIYYIHDESNMMQGYSLLIGPKNTPYEYGYYLFKINYPNDYPLSPPIMTYLTNDGKTRFHPNLYRNGKVCLSILNTWKGEQWSSCQTIRSLLLTLISILDQNPLCNEPGFSIYHKDCLPYTNSIWFKNYEIAIMGIINNKYLPNECKIFNDIIKLSYKNNYDSIIGNLKKYSQKINEDKTIPEYNIGIYNMSIKTDYYHLLQQFNKLLPN